MTAAKLKLSILPETLAICRLGRDAPFPAWALAGGFVSLTRTAEELSVVCLQANVPEGVQQDGGWRCLKVEGPLDLSLTGVLASLAMPLAHEGIGVFAISTYDTDYVLVKREDLEKAAKVLRERIRASRS